MAVSTDVDLDAHFVEPTGTHRSTVILLHGTSQTGPEFSQPFLNFTLPFHSTSLNPITNTNTTLALLFPHTRWVFPTGHRRKTTVFDGNITNAWFDIHNFSDRTIGECDAIPGLRRSAISLTRLIASELAFLGPDGNLVIGGFSQGSAMSIFLLLSGELESLGIGSGNGGVAGVVKMSGWLPFRRQIGEVIDQITPEDGLSRRKAVRRYVRNLLELEEMECEDEFLDVPVWLGHGEADEKMKLHWGVEMRDMLSAIGIDVSMSTYPGLAHWWDEREMGDLVEVLKRMLS
ncbi:Alpha/Beta hydrolase protein [Calycina marina]|uniref:Alpha/Beta hydrolase protein n=1 Tax=Calycina marina TaxID=1763456 RepID=A0A9P8CDS7_9HELO|nr:Alpha/Beta hydrolase protein [Calycina marina]